MSYQFKKIKYGIVNVASLFIWRATVLILPLGLSLQTAFVLSGFMVPMVAYSALGVNPTLIQK